LRPKKTESKIFARFRIRPRSNRRFWCTNQQRVFWRFIIIIIIRLRSYFENYLHFSRSLHLEKDSSDGNQQSPFSDKQNVLINTQYIRCLELRRVVMYLGDPHKPTTKSSSTHCLTMYFVLFDFFCNITHAVGSKRKKHIRRLINCALHIFLCIVISNFGCVMKHTIFPYLKLL